MNGYGRVFTSENLALIKQMAAQGCSAREIASAIGSTPSSVRVKCSYQKIRLRRGRGRPPGPASLPVERSVDFTRQSSVVSYLPASVFAEFNRKADELRMSASALASMLLNVVATSDLYKAVLDD